MLRTMHKAITTVALVVALAGSAVMAQNPRATLHERSKKASGKLVWKYRANRSVIYRNIEDLAKQSDAIFIGRTLGHRPALSADGKFITNDFLVRVQDVIKGDLPNGRSILVSVPGGAYRFPDRTYAAVIPTGYKEPSDGKTYVFFLKKNANFKGHMLVSESQGLFELSAGTVDPADLITRDPVVLNYKGMTVANFLRELHKAVPRKKK